MQQAQAAYQDLSGPTKTDRALEYEAIARVTARLKRTNDQISEFGALVSAIDENRNLWRFIATSVSDAENQLPKNLRAQLFFLAEFTSLHSKKVLAKEANATPLIDINLSVMRGLGMEQNP